MGGQQPSSNKMQSAKKYEYSKDAICKILGCDLGLIAASYFLDIKCDDWLTIHPELGLDIQHQLAAVCGVHCRDFKVEIEFDGKFGSGGVGYFVSEPIGRFDEQLQEGYLFLAKVNDDMVPRIFEKCDIEGFFTGSTNASPFLFRIKGHKQIIYRENCTRELLKRTRFIVHDRKDSWTDDGIIWNVDKHYWKMPLQSRKNIRRLTCYKI